MILIFLAELGLGPGSSERPETAPDLAGPARHGSGPGPRCSSSSWWPSRTRRGSVRPDSGCGCFGELSGTPIGLRTVARSARLCASAASFGLPPLRMPPSSTMAGPRYWPFEPALIAFLSPELGEIMLRLGCSEPWELRRVPVSQTMTALHPSSPGRKYSAQTSAGSPSGV